MVMNFSQVFSSFKMRFVKKCPKTYEFFTDSVSSKVFPINDFDELHSVMGGG